MSEQNEKRIAYDCQIYLDASPDDGWMQALRTVPGVSGCERMDYLLADHPDGLRPGRSSPAPYSRRYAQDRER